MKSFLIGILSLMLCSSSFGQALYIPSTPMYQDTTITFDSISHYVLDQLATLYPYDTTEGGPTATYSRWSNFWSDRMSSNAPSSVAKPDPANIALRYAMGTAYSTSNCTPNGDWHCVGPFIDAYDNSTGNETEAIGRFNQVWVNPLWPDIILAGSEAGGLWKSTNGGEDWFNITDGVSPNGFLII